MYSVGKSNEGDFTYDYAPNPNIIVASGITNTTKKRMLFERDLQTAGQTQTKITNPVMCIKQGSAVLFTVDTLTKSYPQYLKDSILNTNPNFDYGQFMNLKTTVDQGMKVTAFSFAFNEPGVYVFQDSRNLTKITIIGVLKESQECSTKDANI